ncbi:MAG TPA: hypothetical protein VJJ02_03320 [Candidatus Paceibacterota bacterium]
MHSGILVMPNEKHFLHPVSETFVQRGGFNSEIFHIHYTEGGRKVVEKRVGAKRGGFEFTQAGEIARDVLQYQHELVSLGVSMPEIERLALNCDVRDGQTLIYLVAPWTGLDMEVIINQWRMDRDPTCSTVRHLVREMCALLKRVCTDRLTAWDVRVGIDPKASNFTLDETGQVWYVDPFPPRYRKYGKPIIEWTMPKTELGNILGYFKYYDVRGILLGFTAQLARVKPSLKKIVEDVALEEFRGTVPEAEWAEFCNELSRSPWRLLREALHREDDEKRARAEDIIRHCVTDEIFGIDYHVYTLREIALELAYAGVMTSTQMEKFFQDSHFEERLPDERIKELQSVLCTFIGKE